jgi:hypothetical protein
MVPAGDEICALGAMPIDRNSIIGSDGNPTWLAHHRGMGLRVSLVYSLISGNIGNYSPLVAARSVAVESLSESATIRSGSTVTSAHRRFASNCLNSSDARFFEDSKACD